MRARRVAIAVVAALGAGLGAAVVTAPAATRRASAQTPSFLYVLQAREGWAAKQPNGHWRMSLLGVSAFEFSDRPVRIARAIPVDRFVSGFKHLFEGSRPNAAFVVQRSPPGQAPTAVEILKAFWEKPGQLALCMCTIGSEPKAVQWLSQLTRASAPRHGEITIFIDSGPPIHYAADRAWRRSARRRR